MKQRFSAIATYLLVTSTVILFALVALTPLAIADVVTINFSAPTTNTFGIANPGTQISGTVTYDTSLATYNPIDAHSGFYTVPTGTFTFATDGGVSLTLNLTGIFVDDTFSHPGYQFVANVGTPNVTQFLTVQFRLYSFSSSAVPDTSIPTALNTANFSGSEIFYDRYDSSMTWTGQVEHCCSSNDIFVDVTVAAAVPNPPPGP